MSNPKSTTNGSTDVPLPEVAGEPVLSDPLVEADSLQRKLRDALTSVRRLAASLRRQNKHEKLVRATLASLRTLEAG